MTNSVHIPRKRFGQNCLHDQSVIHAILANLQIRAHDHWVEIGPGQGALTWPLAENNIDLDVVELDRDLVALLKKQFAGRSNINIHSADALKFDFSALVRGQEKLRIVGNLPYNISTPLLFHLLESASVIHDMHFMLQKEVVERMCASPGNKQYGRLSIMLQYQCAAESLFEVQPESFDPAPKVVSAVVRLVPHRIKPVEVQDKALFDKIVSQAFSQRRKTLRNSLKTLVEPDMFSLSGIDPAARAENLSLQDYARFANLLIQN
jgi:16S rRNA (adenine1518-N6/adenine1519-N6)-dimethyltransferase